MRDVELFIHMAEIAGVFVGFGALIAIRSGPLPGIANIRWVVTSAIWVVVAALAPIIVSRYGVTGHELWLTSGLFALVVFGVTVAVNGLSPEMKADREETLAVWPLARIVMVMFPTFWLPARHCSSSRSSSWCSVPSLTWGRRSTSRQLGWACSWQRPA